MKTLAMVIECNTNLENPNNIKIRIIEKVIDGMGERKVDV